MTDLYICNISESKTENKNVSIRIFSFFRLGVGSTEVSEWYGKYTLAFSWQNYCLHMHLDVVPGELGLRAETYNPAKIHSTTLCHSRNYLLRGVGGLVGGGTRIWPPDLSSLPSREHVDFLRLHIAAVRVSLGLSTYACSF